MPEQAQLVIIGSGIVGCAAAYHLVELGWKDIIVVDKGELFENDGSTSHAPGGVVPLSHSKIMTQFGMYTADLIKTLKPFREDRNTCNPVGQLEVAISEERWQDMIRLHGTAKAFGVETHLLSPEESVGLIPVMDSKAFVGSLHIPSGCIVKGADVSGAFARDAQEKAESANSTLRFMSHTAVTETDVKDGKVVGVKTNNPEVPYISCESVLLCANVWSPAMTEQFGVDVPLRAFEHQYSRLEPMDNLSQFDPNNKDHEVVFPTMRELDSGMYYRQHWNSYGLGNYGHTPHMVRAQDLFKDLSANAMYPFTPEDFYGQPWENAVRLFPSIKDKELVEPFNGLMAFSVDGMPIIGETKVKGFWTATASWITHAAGVAKSVAEWMTYGDTEWDMRQASVNRFLPFQTPDAYISVVTKKNYREVYEIVHPRQSISEPRNVRMSPFAPRLDALGADYTAFAGLELPNWFRSNEALVDKYASQIPERSGWAAKYWSPIQGAEHIETRENVAVFDLTGLSIIEVRGSEAVGYLDYLCSNKMDVAIGKTVYTTWLTSKGGVKRDLAVTRMSVDSYWLFVGEGTLPQDLAWVEQHAPQDDSVCVSDISNSYTALGLWGPNARKVLEKVTSADVSHEGFPYFGAKWIDVGMAKVLALRVSYAGELGWELHFPMDAALPVWDCLWEAGREFNMIAAGMGAFDSLRLEKGYRGWGSDVHTEYSPYEAGLGWTVKLKKKADYIGKEACKELKPKALKKQLCCMTFDDVGSVAFGGEAIFAKGSDEALGYATSANFGYSVGKFIFYGYLPSEQAGVGTEVELEYFGKRYAAQVVAEPVFDTEMKKILV